MKLLNNVTQCSGLKIYIDNTKAKHIGSSDSPGHYHHTLSWIRTPHRKFRYTYNQQSSGKSQLQLSNSNY